MPKTAKEKLIEQSKKLPRIVQIPKRLLLFCLARTKSPQRLKILKGICGKGKLIEKRVQILK